jgi:hypothetical protein
VTRSDHTGPGGSTPDAAVDADLGFRASTSPRIGEELKKAFTAEAKKSKEEDAKE